MSFSPAPCGWGQTFSPIQHPAFSEGVDILCVYLCMPALHTHAHCCVVEEGQVLNLRVSAEPVFGYVW